MSSIGVVIANAEISDCGKYRYSLTRAWKPKPSLLLWIMLNPSTADATVDDPTIRRCMGFARAWGYGGIEVVNLFAYRATDPKELIGLPQIEAEGPINARTVESALLRASESGAAVVAAWGAGYRKCKQPRLDIEGMARSAGVALWCLGETKLGDPRHPLYVPNTQRAVAWPDAGNPKNQGAES